MILKSKAAYGDDSDPFSYGTLFRFLRFEMRADMNAPSASLRSENDEIPSAVEMPPRGKRGKLKKRVSHSFHRAWKSGKKQERRIPTFPPRRRRVYINKDKNESATRFQLTDAGHF